MTSRNFKKSMVNQDQEIIFEVVKVSGSWVFPAASSIVEATSGKNMYLRLTDDGKSDIFRLDFVKDGENAGETVFGFVGNGGMDLVELTTTTDGTGATTGSWDYEPGKGPAGEAIVAVFEVSPGEGKPYPTFAEINSEVLAGKIVVLRRVNYDGRSDSPADYYYLHNYSSAPNSHSYTFSNGMKTKSVTSLDVWSEADVVYGLYNGGSKTEADLVEGELAIASANSLTKLTLTTVQTLTVKANGDIPNFALEIDNTGNSNDVTVTVQDSTGMTTLNASVAGGDTVGAGKYVQLTCVGSCWTLAEFTVPTP